MKTDENKGTMLTFAEVSSRIANYTRVRWASGSRAGGRQRLESTGVIEGYDWADMPWKLYQIKEDGTGRIALVHPDHILRTWGPPHQVSLSNADHRQGEGSG